MHERARPGRGRRPCACRVSPMPPPGEDPDAAPSCSSSDTSEPQDQQRSERALSNGDLYLGQWRGGVPHGDGKYLWADGCMYEGEWRRGKATTTCGQPMAGAREERRGREAGLAGT